MNIATPPEDTMMSIYASNRFWPEPLIQINPSYRRTTSVEALVAAGVLHRRVGDIFRARGADGEPPDVPEGK